MGLGGANGEGRTNIMFIRVLEKFAKGALSEFLPAALGEAMVVRGVGAHCNEWKRPEAGAGYATCFAAAAMLLDSLD